MAPLPNSSGCLVSRFSVAYDRKVGISAPPAGSAPNGKPSAVPRSQGFHDRLKSCFPIHGVPTGMTSAGLRRRCAATHIASPTAKIPTATTTTSMPSASCGMPRVSRCCPETASMPTRPIVSPSSSEIRPRIREAPNTEVTAMNDSSIRAK